MTTLQTTAIELQIESFRNAIINNIYKGTEVDVNVWALAKEMMKAEVTEENLYEFEMKLNEMKELVTSNPSIIAQDVYYVFQYVPQATNYKLLSLIFPNVNGETNLDATIKMTMLA